MDSLPGKRKNSTGGHEDMLNSASIGQEIRVQLE